MKIKQRGHSSLMTILLIAALLSALFAVSVAYFSINVTGNDTASSVIVTTVNLGNIVFLDGSEINVTKVYPGWSITKTFTIENAAEAAQDQISYAIFLNVTTNEITPLSEDAFVYSLSGTSTNGGTIINLTDVTVPIKTGNNVLSDNGILNGKDKHTYTFKIELKEIHKDQNAVQGKVFSGVLQVDIAQGEGVRTWNEETSSWKSYTTNLYKESILNGAYPRISEGMIPVTIANNGTVTTANPNSTWYSYASGSWANVVLVKESGTNSRAYYQTNYNVTVSEADILAYLVWIPRYRYTLWNVAGTASTYTGGCSNASYYSQTTCEANSGTWTTPNCTANCPRSIEITFENSVTAKSSGTTNGSELTHPAFTYGGREVNGIWVGKFETTQGTAANVGTANPTVKPNITSWKSQNVSTEFATSQKFSSNAAYGLRAESKMSTNAEWGAIAYLSHSVYGINTEIRINNNSGYKTGCGASADNLAATSSCEITYGAASSYPQSTTGNITGIFDMSGGAYEYQMSVYTNATNDKYSGLCNIYDSGFKGLYGNPSYTGCDSGITSNITGLDYPNTKYYKLYTSSGWQSKTSYLGEALGETNSWYKDFNYFVSASAPWFYRGGFYSRGVGAGGFSLYYSNGSASGSVSFRSVVLTY